MVTVERLVRAVRLVDDLACVVDAAEFPGVALPGLARLVGCDIVTYNEIGTSARAVRYADFPPGALDPASRAVFGRFAHQHPLVDYYRRTGDPRPMMISDLLGRQRFHALGLYAEFFAPIPVEFQLAMTVADARSVVVGFAFNRATGDFAESDREVLAALRGPLLAALRRCRTGRLARHALGGAGDEGLAGLTDREFRVLELVAAGRTNQAIADALGVSPRTVAKHLEHAYRKLSVTNRAAATARLAGLNSPAVPGSG